MIRKKRRSRRNSLWMQIAGGGFKGGCIYGRTDDVGYTIVENRFTVPDMFATILHQLGLDHRRVHFKHAGRFEDATDSVVTGATIHDETIRTTLLGRRQLRRSRTQA